MVGIQFNPFAIPVFIAAIILSSLTYYAWQNRSTQGARFFMGLTFTAGLWATAYGFELTVVDLVGKWAFHSLTWTVIPFLPLTWFFFTLTYTGRDRWVTRWTIGLVALVPVVTVLLVWTDPLHHLHYSGGELVTVGSVVFYDSGTPGPWWWVHAIYNWLVMFAGIGVIVWSIIHSHPVYRKQLIVVLTGILVGLLANFVSAFGLLSLQVDITSTAFAGTGLITAFALFRYDFLGLTPVARDAVIDNMKEGVVIVDEQNRVVDVNDRALDVLGVDSADAIGTDVHQLFPSLFESTDLDLELAAEETINREVTIHDTGRTRHFDVVITPLGDPDVRELGYIFVLHDVTQRKRRETELQSQKQRLDEFASVISHDLQNPLSAAELYVNRAKQKEDFEYLDQVVEAHDRMDDIIDDVLTLARQGKTVDELQDFDLEDPILDAWETSQTAGATLTVETDGEQIRADESRLLQVFENLFRNAVDHGGEDVTVRVGTLEDDSGTGIYVEDTGEGIPAYMQEQIFEHGYTTSDEGTGLGLSIVKSIVEAHGWDVRVTESTRPDGGSRFEITGIELR